MAVISLLQQRFSLGLVLFLYLKLPSGWRRPWTQRGIKVSVLLLSIVAAQMCTVWIVNTLTHTHTHRTLIQHQTRYFNAIGKGLRCAYIQYVCVSWRSKNSWQRLLCCWILFVSLFKYGGLETTCRNYTVLLRIFLSFVAGFDSFYCFFIYLNAFLVL